ncbi:MAG TPA: transglycosylase SLT domain-containing protein [Nitrolancea sp.]|nr:transglycosylase SLT domain-containing protein [Nitrolancea sp.]
MKRWILFGVIVALVTTVAAPATVLGAELALDPTSAPSAVSQLWARADGPAARSTQTGGWLWGPALRAMTTEPYVESPNGARAVFYFDKARMEISDPNKDPQSQWYVTAGLLVRDLIAGQIQVGNDAFVPTAPAQVAVTGDIDNNPLSPTYATLAPLASIGANIAANRSPNHVGQTVTALLQADGTVVPGAVSDSAVAIGGYDDVLGHNIPKLFTDWMANQTISEQYLVGHPLTEPFWVNSMVGGKQKRVLMQAFERRVLTYTPDNPAGWKVESGNVGLDYRFWHGLVEPTDQNLVPVASKVPFGEIVTEKAQQYGLDPYLFAAVAKVSSNYNPLFQSQDSREGFFGVRTDYLSQQAYPLDPRVNADVAAKKLAELHQGTSDWRAVLAQYFTGSANPDWSNQALNDFVNGVLNTQATLISDLNQPPVQLASEPPTQTPAPAQTQAQGLTLLGTGQAAYYSSSYSTAWWDNTLQKYASWGSAAAGWALDPNGYYCVRPGFTPGQRIQLTANGVTLWCTVGDTVATQDLANWKAKWVIELSWNTFQALKLAGNNHVEVRAP